MKPLRGQLKKDGLKKTDFFSVVFSNPKSFLGHFAVVFLGMIILLYSFGFVPQSFAPTSFDWKMPELPQLPEFPKFDFFNKKQDPEDPAPVQEDKKERNTVDVSTVIERVTIDSVGIDAKVYHPTSQSVTVLDEYLQKGAVYYPGSGTPASGNIFIFGHSTNWAIVQNQAYKTFNNLEDTKKGDRIVLESENGEFIYEIQTVKTVTAEEVLVEFNTNEKLLTISTCNTFGEKQERHVVEAKLVDIRAK